LPQNTKQVNIFKGRVIDIESLGENAEVTFKLEGGEILIGVITLQESKLLQKNSTSYACISNRHVILGL
jgi:molybdopterin-binding protein